MVWSGTFRRFVQSEQASGFVLLACTVLSLLIANSPFGAAYAQMWGASLGPLRVDQWINDALMAVFFLLIGLELERELYVGELSDPRNALLPIAAAVGGMIAPALIHFALNGGSPAQAGFGIPMATDIAFALGVLALLGTRVPASLKLFVVAFAVIDDLGAIVVIAVFYTADISFWYLAASLGVWSLLLLLNRMFRVMALAPYLAGGALMWFLMHESGIHATIAGVLLAFAIPFTSVAKERPSPSHQAEEWLHLPVAFVILPVFALANTAIAIGSGWLTDLGSANSLGIMLGLLVGKPLGIVALCAVAIGTGVCRLPEDVRWNQLIGAGLLGGVGFTMSIFIANLAFPGNQPLVDASKISILAASAIAGVLGYLWLRCCRPADRKLNFA